MHKTAFSFAAAATLLMAGTAIAAPNVVASTKPIHSLVAAVMGDTGAPILLVKGAASPHDYALRPSDAAALESADIVFWTGPGFEMFLADALKTLSSNAEIIELSKADGIKLLPVREGGAFEAHDHAHDHEGHDHDHDDHSHDEHTHDDDGHDHHEASDLHFWLDPENAALMVTDIAAELSVADPDNAAIYAANAEATRAELSALTAEIAGILEPVAAKPFVVFHDAYQYFEARFGLTLAGTVTVSPEAMPGAGRIDELRTKVAELGATCVFAEPNFQPAIVNTIVEGTEAKVGTLDPEGSALSEGPGLYAELLRTLATDIADCLN
jgi:zinc transport system substrate-binding protein